MSLQVNVQVNVFVKQNSLQVYFGTQHSKMYLNANFLGINCMTGMSCLFRREVLDEVGGLAVLSSTLAEDFYLGQIFHDR